MIYAVERAIRRLNNQDLMFRVNKDSIPRIEKLIIYSQAFFLKCLYSLIYPYFYYCNIVWASTYKTNIRQPVILQRRRIIRIMNKSHFNARTDPIFKDLGILKFNGIHLLQLGQFMYSCKNSFLPPTFNNNFSQSNQFHSCNTRNSQAYRPPYCRTNTKKFSRFFQGPKFFNSLDNKVINSQPLSSFKKNLKIKLLSKYENSL